MTERPDGEHDRLGFWRRRSLRFWLLLCALVSILPTAVSAVAGYFLFQSHIVQPLTEIAEHDRTVLSPLLNLPLRMWEATEALDDYRIDGDPKNAAAYDTESKAIETDFERLLDTVRGAGMAGTADMIEAARTSYREALRVGESVSAGTGGAPTPDGLDMETIEDAVMSSGRILDNLHDNLSTVNDAAFRMTLKTVKAAEIMAAAALAIGLVFMLLSVALMEKSLVASVDELVQGATRVAAGDREHQVRVTLPPELRKVASAFNAMTDRIAEQEQALAQMARTDGLTGLLNRREFDRELIEWSQQARRHGEPVALLMIDIDHFKKFNDAHGHQGGDMALAAVAAALRDGVRTVDRAFRYGGEELAAILPRCDAEAARQVAERLRATVAGRSVPLAEGGAPSVTISLGVAVFPADGESPEALLKAADVALYRSKADGRNRVSMAGASVGEGPSV